MERTEAIEVIRKCWPVNRNGMLSDALETLIPELRESEDEKIRKVIRQLLSGMREEIFTAQDEIVTKEKALDWLEKQKEQKFTHHEIDESLHNAVTHQMEDDGDVDDFVRKGIDDIVLKYAELGARWQKEQKPFSQEVFDAAKHEALWGEQKPAEWKPEPESLEALMYAIEGKWEMIKPTSYLSRMLEDLYEGLVNTYNVDESFLAELPKTAYTAEDIEELRALKAKIEASMEDPITKSAEKQDYTELNDLERAIHRGFLSAGVENVPVEIIKETAKECLAQMKSAEWSEEDKRILDEAIGMIEARGCWVRSEDAVEQVSDFLKSLPDRFNLQPKQELSEFEKAIKDLVLAIDEGELRELGVFEEENLGAWAIKQAAELLVLAKQQLLQSGELMTQEHHEKLMETQYNETLDGVKKNWRDYFTPQAVTDIYNAGRNDVLKDLPRWGKGSIEGDRIVGLSLYHNMKWISFSDLEKLPGFKDDESHE